MTGYIWSSTENNCIIDCLLDSLSTGVSQNGQCQCLDTAIWDQANQACALLNCESILYTAGINAEKTACNCESSKFAWNNVKKICEIDCTSFEDLLGTGIQMGINQCGCISGKIWDFTAYQCRVDCSADHSSTGENLSPN